MTLTTQAVDALAQRSVTQQAAPFRMPRPGDLWRHHKGGRYCVIDVAIDTATGQPTVIYVRKPVTADDPVGVSFTRDLSNFLGFTEGHQRRFTYESGLDDAT